MTILKVNTNLKHNGDHYGAGQLFEAEQSAFQTLINSGVLEIIKGAETIAEAETILSQKGLDQSETTSEQATASQDTWGPKKDEPVAADPIAPSPQTPVIPAEGAEPAKTDGQTVPVAPENAQGAAVGTDPAQGAGQPVPPAQGAASGSADPSLTGDNL